MEAVTVLIQASSAKSGGAETYLRNILDRLAQLGKGHRYVVLVPPALAKVLQQRDRVTLRETPASPSAWQRLIWDQGTTRLIIRREKIDVLVASSDFGMLFPPCPEILLLRNSLFFSALYRKKILPSKSFLFKLDYLLRRWLVALSIKHASVVMTASRTMLNEVRRSVYIPETKTCVNPFGVSAEKFHGLSAPISETSGGPLRLLHVSEYSDYKNLTVLLKSLLGLKALGLKDFVLSTTAGPDPFPDVEISSRAADRSLAGNPSIAPHLHYVGSVPFEEISALYRKNDLFLFPSLSESFGHPLVEAMASGLPILAADIPICREICAEAAVYFDPFDSKALADKILLLWNDPGLRKRLASEGRNRVEKHFHWDRHAQRFLEVAEQLAGER